MGLETELRDWDWNLKDSHPHYTSLTRLHLLILPKQVHQLGPRIRMCEAMGAFLFKAPPTPAQMSAGCLEASPS